MHAEKLSVPRDSIYQSVKKCARITACIVLLKEYCSADIEFCLLENTSIIAAAHTTPDSPITPQNTSGFISSEEWVLLGRAI